MRKTLLMVPVLSLLSFQAHASPLSDLLIGASLLITGGLCDGQRGRAASAKDEAQKQFQDHNNKAIIADENAFYYLGAAEWEFIINGNTANYQTLLAQANNFNTQFNNESAAASDFSGTAEGEQNRERWFKGASVVSYSAGGFLILKGAWGYWKARSPRKQEEDEFDSWSKSFNFSPTRDMAGAQISYQVRFGS